MDEQTSQGNNIYAEDNSFEQQAYKRQASSFFGQIRYYLYMIWPTVIKVLSFFVYHTIRIGRETIKTIIAQIRFGG